MKKLRPCSAINNKTDGFSVVEMLVCLSLLGLVLSISSISYPIGGLRFNESINNLKSDLRNTIVLAQDTSVSYKFKIDSQNKSYSIENYKGGILEKRILEKDIYIGYDSMTFNIGSLNRSGGSSTPLSLYVIDTSRKKAERITLMLGTSRVHSYSCDYKLALLELSPSVRSDIDK